MSRPHCPRRLCQLLLGWEHGPQDKVDGQEDHVHVNNTGLLDVMLWCFRGLVSPPRHMLV